MPSFYISYILVSLLTGCLNKHFSIFVGKLWLLLKYCIYCVSTPSPYRESTNSLIMLPNIEGSIGNICCVVRAGCLILAISLPDWGPDYRHVYDPHLQNTWVPDCLPRLLLSIIPNEKKPKQQCGRASLRIAHHGRCPDWTKLMTTWSTY